MNYSEDPLQGVPVERLLTTLVDHFGWQELGDIVDIRCFRVNPSVKSSVTFLRKTPWALKKVQDLYISILPPPAKEPAPEEAPE